VRKESPFLEGGGEGFFQKRGEIGKILQLSLSRLSTLSLSTQLLLFFSLRSLNRNKIGNSKKGAGEIKTVLSKKSKGKRKKDKKNKKARGLFLL